MKKFSPLVVLLLLAYVLNGQSPVYKRVKIHTGENGLLLLARNGFETDHGQVRKSVWFISDFSEAEIRKIESLGLRYEILIDNVSDYYRNQPATERSTPQAQQAGCTGNGSPVYNVPTNFSLGSMGGYFTYQEMLDHLDSMVSKFPNLISARQPVGPGITINGNTIYYVKISDNPNVSEPEPQMLYTALHHAREPESLSQLIFYMWYLLENYNSSATIQNVVNNSELYFITCVNPDGYQYNELTDPGGGGMWRKNRRDNLDGSFGVDLNRNYGYNWGIDDNGSSPDGVDETYRGTAPFSETETQLVSDFVNQHNFKIALNYHTYGNLFIYPWGYQPDTYTPDSALFVNYGKLLTTYNAYTYGTANQTVGYVVNGSSDDWMYGEQVAKPKVFACTPEVGDGMWGFWPPSSEIIPLAQGTVFQNLTAAQLLGRYASLKENSPSIVQQVSGYIKFTITQLGLDTSGTYTVSLNPVSSNISSTGSPKLFSSMSLLETRLDSISFSLNTSGLQYGDAVRFALSIDNGQFVVTDTLTKIFGIPSVAYNTNANSLTGWTGQWGLSTSIFYSPTASITDSPSGNYNNNSNRSTRLSNPVNLINAVAAQLTFYARWEIEPGYDFAQVSVSTDNGNTWNPLCGKYTVTGSGDQDPGQPVYDGFQTTWVKEEMDLGDYLNQNILIRFRLLSDGFQNYDGFYFDDLEINKIMPGGVGVHESLNNSAPNILCFPNPSEGELNFIISQSLKDHSRIILEDVSGRRVREILLEKNTRQKQVSISDLENGVYYFRLENGNQSFPAGKVVLVK